MIKNHSSVRLTHDFFKRDVIEVAPDLIGKIIVRKFDDGTEIRTRITEDEAYTEKGDLGCNAPKGRSPKTEMFYHEGGSIFIYICYGVHYMLNFTTGLGEYKQGILIRSVEGVFGPGKVSKFLGIDKSFSGEDTATSKRIWLEDDGTKLTYQAGPRINIDYAEEPWLTIPWRFFTAEVAKHGAKISTKARQALRAKEAQSKDKEN